MKSNGFPRGATDSFGPEDVLQKATKLPPLKRSGKEKQSFYREMDDDDLDLIMLQKRESILDYFDDGEEASDEWDEQDDDDVDELEEDLEEEWTDDAEEPYDDSED